MESVTVYYLEMLSRSALQGKEDPRGLSVIECRVKQFPLNKFLYDFIGAAWQWLDKKSWNDNAWKSYVERDDLRTWIAYHEGAIAGYYELSRQSDGSVEIIYFGLAEQFIGNGWGGYLLTEAIRSAWEWQGTRRVWVHTCSLDHPHALRNYLDRGMTLYRTETILGPVAVAEHDSSLIAERSAAEPCE